MIRPISNVRRHTRTLMAIVLLAGWPAVAGAEELGNTALVLHPDAYSYDNEGHASSWGQTTTAPEASTPSVQLASPAR